MGLDFKIENNFEEFYSNYDEAKERMMYAIGSQWLKRVTEIITNRHKNAREGVGIVDTGRLRGSMSFSTSERSEKSTKKVKENKANDYINKKAEDGQLFVGTNVEYAEYIEIGNSKMKARPFLSASLTEYKQEYKDLAEEVLKGNI